MTHEIREAMCGRGILASLSISVWAGNKLEHSHLNIAMNSTLICSGGAIALSKQS